MQQLRLLSVIPVVLALLVACRASPPSVVAATGSVQVAVSTSQALSASDISRITVTTSAADMPSITIELTQTAGKWGGVIADIPAGTNRTFHAQAFDSADTIRYERRVEKVTIAAASVTHLSLPLQETATSTPFTNEAPIIESVVASPLVVAPGAKVTLVASAHDPNPDDILTVSWTAAAGSFDAPTKLSTLWTAPPTTGLVTMKLTVTDSRGAASSVTLLAHVSTGEGAAVVYVSFNSPPKMVSLTSSQSYLDVGQQTTLAASASDPDADSLTYSWTATCAGTFDAASSPTARFTPTALPTAACNNCQMLVTISDNRGGRTTGTLALCVSSDAVRHLPPTIVRSYQSSFTAKPSQQLTFEVFANDPEDSPISFTWSASVGSLSTAQNLPSSSRITWTAPSCVTGSTTPSIDAVVTNDFNLTTTKHFAVTGLPTCSSWSLTGALSQQRNRHTATLLPNGKVLVEGGWNNPFAAEVYDPNSGTWSATGPMISPRGDLHTATLLLDGKVLVAGGMATSGTLAELYDPASNTWSATGSMAMYRRYHTATLLRDGKVLVAGGLNTNGTLVEVYDPALGTWSPTGSMKYARYFHTATLLPDGKVLVAGGFKDTSSVKLATAEVYDPVLGTWTAIASMSAPRSGHTATLLADGTVLIAGGNEEFTAAEVYDPAVGIWRSVGSMPLPVFGHRATLLPNGKVLITGGHQWIDNTDVISSAAKVYDPATGAWIAVSSMRFPRYDHTATLLLNGQVLVAAGWDNQSTAELYVP